MQRGDERRRLAREQRERIIVEMEVQEVELVGAPTHMFEHRHVQRVRIAHRSVEPQRARPERFKLGAGL